jgi:hypothetical protein
MYDGKGLKARECCAVTFRLPQNLSTQLGVETGASALDTEIRAETAASLGRAGRRVETALMALRTYGGADVGRDTAVAVAAAAVHEYFIQRELCGLRDQGAPVRDYAIPSEVLARIGARSR